MFEKTPGPVALDPDGFNELRMCRSGPMIYNKNDVYVGGSLRKYGEFSWMEHELFAQIAKPGFVIVEAGANIGAHTVGLSKLVGARGAVLAFEPQRIVFQTLCANLALNQCTNVLPLQEACGAAESEILVPELDPAQPANFGALSLRVAEAGQKVRVRTIDSFALPACHMIKADVEGMEIEVVRGAVETIRSHRPVLYLENDRRENSHMLLELLFAMGYAAYWDLPPLYNPDNFYGEAENIFPNIVSINILCMPLDRPIALQGFRRVVALDEWWF